MQEHNDSPRHTPGPWKVLKFTEAERLVVTNRDGTKAAHREIAALEIGFTARVDAEQYANARLIAAAPDLLEACQQAEHWLAQHDRSMEPVEMLRVLRAAITKAGVVR